MTRAQPCTVCPTCGGRVVVVVVDRWTELRQLAPGDPDYMYGPYKGVRGQSIATEHGPWESEGEVVVGPLDRLIAEASRRIGMSRRKILAELRRRGVAVDCPTCGGKGKVTLADDALRRLAGD